MKRLDQLYFRYAENSIVFTDLTIEFPSYEVSYVIGSSGVGKTTLALLLAGELKPISGIIFPTEPAALAVQFPEMLFLKSTLIEEIKSFGALIEQDKARRLLSRFGIDWELQGETAPESFSFAQRRLIAIALQAARNENTLVLDEPTLGLDEENLCRVAEFVREDCASRRELVIITHDLDLLHHVPGTVFLLANGRCPWHGPSTEYLGRPDLLNVAKAN